jgi:dihydrofolate reductase
MRKLIVNEFMTLDGVAQAPGGPDEDTSGDFKHGGWHMRFMDDAAREWVMHYITRAGGFLLGRRTYEIFASYWPKAGQEEAEIARPLNTLPKWVVSSTLTPPLTWQNSTLLEGGLVDAVNALKRQDGGDIQVIGSTKLVQSLVENSLVDSIRLMIDPVMVGGGKGIFRRDGRLRPMRLVESKLTSTGAILATYAPASAEAAEPPRQATRPAAREKAHSHR